MSIAVTAGAVGAANSAANSAQLKKLKQAQCKVYIEGFDFDNPSVENMQYYATCVNELYPAKEEVQAQKDAAMALSLFFVLGFVISWQLMRRSKESFETLDKLVFSIAGGVVGVFAALLTAFICWMLT